MLKKLFDKIKKYVPADMLWVFGSGAASQLFGFLSSVIVVRMLNKAEYGLYVGAYNKYSYFATFLGLGFATTILQYCTENASQSRKNAIMRFGLRFGTGFNFVLMFMMLILGLLMNAQGKGPYLIMMCAYPFFTYLFFYYRNILRSRFDNRGYALMCMSNAMCLCVGNIILTRLFGVTGFIVTTYIAYPLSVFVGIRLLKRGNFFSELNGETDALNRNDKSELIKYSAICASTSFVTIVLGLLDITCLEILTGDSELLADYKVALAIPAAMQTVTDCLSNYYHPILIKMYSGEKDSFNSFVKKVACVYAAVSFVMSAFLFALAPVIIKVIYGAKYMNVVPVFRILCLHLFVSSGLHKLLGYVIMSIKKIRVNLYFSSLSAVLNIVLDVIMIKSFGSVGAAWATFIVSVFITVLEVVFVARQLFSTVKRQTSA